MAMRTVISRAMARCEIGARRSIMLVNVKTAFLYTTQSDRCTLTCLQKLLWIGKLERAMWYSRKTPLDMKFKESVTPSSGCLYMRHETCSFVHMWMTCCAQDNVKTCYG